MVDIRPMLFAHALLIMLIVLAGFGSIQRGNEALITPKTKMAASSAVQDQPASKSAEVLTPTPAEAPAEEDSATLGNATPAGEPAPDELSVADEPPQTSGTAPETDTTAAVQSEADISTSTPMAAASTEPVEAQLPVEPVAIPAPAPIPQIVSGKLIVRSNVSGDMVTINGKVFGPTRTEVDLPAGAYDVEVTKSGFTPWKQQVHLKNGDETELHARLEAIIVQAPVVTPAPVRTAPAPVMTDTRPTQAADSTLRNGPGTLRSANGDSYTGMLKDGKYSGEGTLTKANGDVLSGLWVDGQLNGQGTLTARDGTLYVGAFLKNQYHGEGSLTFPDGRHYQGGFSNGKYHGKGMETFKSGKAYSGQFMDGKYHGQGEIRNPNGSKIASTFRYGKPFGQATLTTPEGEVFTARTNEPGVCYRENSYRATQCPPMEGW